MDTDWMAGRRARSSIAMGWEADAAKTGSDAVNARARRLDKRGTRFSSMSWLSESLKLTEV
jgi:hypothetical protein